MAVTLECRTCVRRISQKTASTLLAFMALLTLVATLPSQAQTYKVLHKFSGRLNKDGANPYSGLLLDAAGNLFGTTSVGGSGICSYGCGVVFKVDTAGNETILHRFYGNTGGQIPDSAVIHDLRGRLYGTTASSYHGAGSVYKLGTNGILTTLHEFTGAADGGNLWAGVVRDAEGNLYGTTLGGGRSPTCESTNGCGTLFKVSPSGVLTVLHSFGDADGLFATGTLVRDAAGNLYGTTSQTVYKVNPSGNLTVLYTFPPGAYGPWAGLVMDGAGNLFGTAIQGGAHGWGEVFEVDYKGKETTLYQFTGGPDGGYPSGGLLLDASGDLYGTTTFGGDLSCTGVGGPGCGTVFKLDAAGKYTVLHTFTGADGKNPWAGLFRDAVGNLYGTTYAGGLSSPDCVPGSCGVVFKLTP